MNELLEAPSSEFGFALAQRAEVKRWLSRICEAKKHWEDDFKRMRENMEFVKGKQWYGQTKIDDERYTVNITLRIINQKVSTVYAKNPEAVAIPRKKLYYQLWDGNTESLISAVQQADEILAMGEILPPELAAFFADVDEGNKHKDQIKRISETLTLAHQYQVDSQFVDFKEQMKSVVRRTDITGVGFCRIGFCRSESGYAQPSSVDAKSGAQDRANRLQGLMRRIADQGLGEDSAEFSQLQSLMMNLRVSQETEGAVLSERVEFDFPLATSIIVDPRCRALKGFIGARWVAQEYILPASEVNEIFGTDIKVGTSEGGAEDKSKLSPTLESDDANQKTEGLVSLYNILDYATKTECWVVEGWKEFVVEAKPLETNHTGFWPIHALTFNDFECEPGKGTSIYPPSLVDQVKSAQKEWNRTREALRAQRMANAPKYLVRKGMMTKADKEALRNAEDNAVIELEGVPPDQNIQDFIQRFVPIPVDPALYETSALEQDILMAAGAQQANLGPAQANVTATVGNIAEQSRLDVTGSDIDDLDSFLSKVAQASGEALLQNMSKETVQQIVGPGAAWPDMPETRIQLSNELLLSVKAASSGRPNKAIAISNFQQIAPMLMQAGANPIGLVEEGVRRLDDNLEVSKFFPLQPMSAPGSVSPTEEQSGPPTVDAPPGPNEQVNSAPVQATENPSQQVNQ